MIDKNIESSIQQNIEIDTTLKSSQNVNENENIFDDSSTIGSVSIYKEDLDIFNESKNEEDYNDLSLYIKVSNFIRIIKLLLLW